MGCVASQPGGAQVVEVCRSQGGRQKQKDTEGTVYQVHPSPSNDEEEQFHEKYVLGAKLGKGAFAQVRIGQKVGPGPLMRSQEPEVAVKIIDIASKEDGTSSSNLKSAKQEANVWKKITVHPNCICLQDHFFGANFCYMVMEKASMGLYQALESMPDVTERALGNVIVQMLLGIAHCHRASIIHRDIKPDNFLVGGDDGQLVKLTDFGLSTFMPTSGKATGTYGTAPFMCPEMLSERGYDEKADVWSAAVIAYAFLFGRFPYMPAKGAGGSKAMKQAIRSGQPPCFEPVSTKSLKVAGISASRVNANYRSEEAMQFVQTVLHRSPECRPSAEAALRLPWMRSALQGCHLPGVELPSLRLMLHSAKKAGAFDVRDLAQVTDADLLLNQMQLKQHGPGKEPKAKAMSPLALAKMKDSWEKSSNVSTTDGESINYSPSKGTSADSDSVRGW